MEQLKTLYGDKALTYAELEAALKDSKEIKLANLAAGQYVDKGKFDSKAAELAAAAQTVKELQTAVQAFDGVDVAALKTAAAEWQTKYNTDIAATKLDSALEVALIAGGAKNTKAVRALLNRETIKLDNDALQGAAEQLDALKKSDPYLFTDAAAARVDSGQKHKEEPGATAAAAMRAAFGLPAEK